jgi:hypothetical protein
VIYETAYDNFDDSEIGKLEIRVWENGEPVVDAESCNPDLEYEPGSELSIRVDGDRVRYYYKELLIYTSKQAASFPLAVQASFHAVGDKVINACLL